MSRTAPLLPRISDYAHYYAQQTPGAIAMVLGSRRIDYRTLAAMVDQCAMAMLAAGITKGDRVATLSTPHPDFLVHFLAAGSIGAIWLGLNPRYTLDEYLYVVRDAEPKLLLARTNVAGRDYRSDLQSLIQQSNCVKTCAVLGGDPLFEGAISADNFHSQAHFCTSSALAAARDQVETTDPALIVYTSGSTGRPKGALLPHRGLTRCSTVQLRYWSPDPIRILNFFPINHVGSVGDVCAYTLVGGGTIVFLEQFDPEEQMKLVEQERITLWGGVPTTLQMSLDLPDFSKYDLSSIQIIAWSGAAASISLATRLLAICPHLSNAYGMTETVGSVTFVPPTTDLEVLTETVGQPVPDYNVRVVGVDGSPVSPGQTGEIVVKGDFVMTGYWHRPKETAESFDEDGYFHTGDLATPRPDGNLKLVGRIREMFKSGGYNVYPFEVEQALEGHEAIALAAVIGVADPLFGEVGHAYIALRPGTAAGEEDLRAHCRRRLANYKIPKRFFIVPQLPMLPIGKIDKTELKRRSLHDIGELTHRT